MFYFAELHLLSCQATMQFAVCTFLWPTATCFILDCYYCCKYIPTFTEKADFLPQLGFSSFLFTFDPQPHSAACGDYIRMLRSRCFKMSGTWAARWVRRNCSLYQWEDEPSKAKLPSGNQSFWQQFLNVVISRTPPEWKKLPPKLSRGLSPGLSSEDNSDFAASGSESAETHHRVGHTFGNAWVYSVGNYNCL